MTDERVKQILDSIDDLKNAHDAWENDTEAPVYLTAPVELAADRAVFTCESGDIPAQCRDLVTAMGRFAIEWGDYKNGIKRTPDHRPLGSFWAAYSAVVLARSHADEFIIKRSEPVFVLYEQKVTENQIAKQMWGAFNKATGKWEGPFVSPDGQVDCLKLREECKEPGKYTKDWIHPEQRERMAERKRLLAHTLGTLQARENADTKTVEKATVVEMLKEGQYPDVIARVKGVALDYVMDEAKHAGITPAIRPNLAAMRAPSELPTTIESSSSPLPDVEVLETDESDTDLEMATRPAVEEYIRSLNDGTRGNPEIAAACREAGYGDISFQKITSVLKPGKAKVTA